MATVACQACGRSRAASPYMAKDGRALCGQCRGKGRPRLGEGPYPKAQQIPCPQCGTAFTPRPKTGGKVTKACSLRCGMLRRYGVPPGSSGLSGHAERYDLERSRPGLTRPQRTRLLRSWVDEGACCVYCGETASTVDHIVPLHGGGTNYIENLVPACRPCNTSKGRKTLTEWGGRRGHPMRDLWDSVPGEAVLSSVLRGALQEEGAAGPEPSR